MLKFQVTASKSPHPQILPSGKTEKKRYACHALRKDITPSTGGFLKALEPGDTEGERGEVTGRRLGPLDGERERERERERESLTYRTNTSNADSFSLISYIYRKIPEPEPDRFYRLSSLVAYPFSYPFFASRLLFPQEYTVVIENKNFSEKISLFSDVFLFVLRTELLLTMCPTWSAGVFFIYGHVLLSSVPDALPRIRAPPLAAPYSGQMPEASPGAALAVMRDAHVLNSSPTRLKRTFH